MGTEPEAFEPTPRRFNPAVIVLVVLVVVAGLVFGVILPLFGGDDEPASPPAARTTTTTTTDSTSPATPPPPPVETFEQFGSKDPFRPLVVEGAPPTSGTTPTTPAPAGVGAGGAPAPSGGQRVQLLDIFDDAGTTKAQIRVGSTVHTVAPGAVFADNFKLVSISGNCATLLHGDDKFTLCEGEEVIK